MLIFKSIQKLQTNLLYGYYQVGAEIYTHKISALINAQKKNVFPTWHFHNKIYEKLNWQENSQFTLDEIYQARAKQLREKYDYLVLSFSGGSDSWTALQAFIDSGTHLDEIFVRWPVAATAGKYATTDKNTHASNILSEWELTILPMLNQYQQLLPRTKITIHDWSKDLLSREVTDCDWMLTQDYLNPGSFLKFQSISGSELQAIDRGIKTAIIFGTDKPQLYYKDGQVFCYFLDKLANSHAYSTLNRVSELFYWTPDMPEITHAQARELFNYLEHNTIALRLINRDIPYDPVNKHIWNDISRSIIYQKYTQLSTFQAKKSYTNVLDEVDSWMADIKDYRYVQSWKSGLTNVLESVGSKFIEKKHNEVTGVVGFVSGDYCLGSITVDN
jgi:hypothetical protein